MCERVVEEDCYLMEFAPDKYKIKETCEVVVLEEFETVLDVSDMYYIQRMCKEDV